LATTNELKEAPTALIVRLPSWSTCRASRLLAMGTEPFRKTDALSSSSQEYRVPALQATVWLNKAYLT
jgi:hypothetical protein